MRGGASAQAQSQAPMRPHGTRTREQQAPCQQQNLPPGPTPLAGCGTPRPRLRPVEPGKRGLAPSRVPSATGGNPQPPARLCQFFSSIEAFGPIGETEGRGFPAERRPPWDWGARVGAIGQPRPCWRGRADPIHGEDPTCTENPMTTRDLPSGREPFTRLPLYPKAIHRIPSPVRAAPMSSRKRCAWPLSISPATPSASPPELRAPAA